jgi:hypothetical protein
MHAPEHTRHQGTCILLLGACLRLVDLTSCLLYSINCLCLPHGSDSRLISHAMNPQIRPTAEQTACHLISYRLGDRHPVWEPHLGQTENRTRRHEGRIPNTMRTRGSRGVYRCYIICPGQMIPNHTIVRGLNHLSQHHMRSRSAARMNEAVHPALINVSAPTPTR